MLRRLILYWSWKWPRMHFVLYKASSHLLPVLPLNAVDTLTACHEAEIIVGRI